MKEIALLKTKIATLETTIPCQPAADSESCTDTFRDVSNRLNKINSICDDAENRMRLSNLLFFGLEDEAEENWAASEEKVIKFCSEKLGIEMSTAQFERVHSMRKTRKGLL